VTSQRSGGGNGNNGNNGYQPPSTGSGSNNNNGNDYYNPFGDLNSGGRIRPTFVNYYYVMIGVIVMIACSYMK
jgi:hypothetical protein